MKLIFAADPMCSWCYGFSKELGSLLRRLPELPLQIRVGGLRAGETEVMSHESKRLRLEHWIRVEQASGMPFNREAFMARRDFVYDTEPACRAVVAARKLAPAIGQLPVFVAIAHAFYMGGRDTTDGAVLAEVTVAAIGRQGHTLSASDFIAEWSAPETLSETAAEFERVRGWGITGFPAVMLERDGELAVIALGYTGAAEMHERLLPMLT